MRSILCIVLLLQAFCLAAQTDSAEVRTGTIFVKKKKTELYVRTRIDFRFVDEDPGYVDKGGLRIGLSKKKKKIIERNEYQVVNPYPEMDSTSQSSFTYTDFFR